MHRVVAAVVALLVVVVVAPANATPVARTDPEYKALGRVFPDPQGGRDEAPGQSPFAKGDVPAVDFIQFQEMHVCMRFL